MFRRAFFAVLLFGYAASAGVGQKSATDNPFPEKFKRLRPSIVEVQVGERRSGTGFFVSADGYVLTALHVVGKFEVQDNRFVVTFLENIQVVLNDGRKLPAQGVPNPAEDSALHDIALLKVDIKNSSFLRLGSYKDVVVGEDAYFMGFPFDAPDVVAYRGMISAKFPFQTGALKGKAIVTDTLHVEAPIARGFSGAPLLRQSDDTVVGVVTNRLGGISPALNAVAEQIVKGRSIGTVQIAGVNPNESILETIRVLDLYLSAGAGWAASVAHIEGLLLEKKVVKSH